MAPAEAPIFKGGDGTEVWVCGSCGIVLADLPPNLSIANIVLKCPNCGSYSEMI
jgi:rubrerythrin